MRIFAPVFALGFFLAAWALPAWGQEATTPDPTGSFVDSFGTSFSFTLCGETGADLCGVLTNLEGESATPENIAFVGQQGMQAAPSAPNQWKGSLNAGGMSAEATITMVGSDTIEIEGCRAALLCQTLAYNRSAE